MPDTTPELNQSFWKYLKAHPLTYSRCYRT